MSEKHHPTTLEDYRQRLLRVHVHIQRHLDEELALDELAAVAHFSPFHFHRVFKGMTGESVKQHVRRLRLERAAVQLEHGNASVTRIALDAGYSTHEAFTRAFRAAFGEAPIRYREQCARRSLERFAGENNPMQAEIRTIDTMRVAFIRHVGPYAAVGSTWGQLCGWAGPRGLLGPNACCLGISYDDPEVTPADKLRYDACVQVGEDVEPEGAVSVQTVGGGRYAVAMHAGPYERMNETYAALMGQWMPENGHTMGASPALEFYLNDPNSTPPAELRTEICVPIGD